MHHDDSTPRSAPARPVQAVRRPRPADFADPAATADTPASSPRLPLSALARFRREHWFLASLMATVSTFVVLTIPGFAGASLEPQSAARTYLQLELPALSEIAEAEPLEQTAAAAGDWTTVTVRPGQTLGAIFSAQGLSATLMHRLLEHPGAREPLTRFRPGAEFAFQIEDGELRALRFDRDEATRVVLHVEGGHIREEKIEREVQRRVQMASGTITESLSEATARAGMSTASMLEMAKVFGYDIDFAQDLRVGDSFHVVYEDIYRDGERLRGGDILAATFINQGKTYQVFRYTFADGKTEYYDGDGRPMKKSFLRMPIDFARLSSRFSNARRHPVLGTVRAHRGVDYAAPTGTPIKAAGDGRISFAGWRSGYGRTVILDHGNGVTTLYAHMSRFSSYKTGARVSQGNTIGYVGASGLASGPHLHYEFRVHGVHRDPLTVTMPKPQPLPAGELARFREQTQPMLARLQQMQATASALASR
ncbi:OapA family protein [Aquimonas voraii]|uniref:Murein DD-endopeptidase MepM and murein hydrolase activator NlpD, contain LysM domain n=1 Tax=Aquimonas voraii TaxID=265719 RepID=A0A1G6ZW22_9GAMM|nr:peptidoglycan DD-metalloendopeptidase family protein [Aquimonas voraii]SDE06720.1 Murein DD-endopeptidase MepM and murein hydrolase activator NlpD, contain LysM domain [Aquimonas voraii]